jgi:hypothetical protein
MGIDEDNQSSNPERTSEGPVGYVFAVGDAMVCCWAHDHNARNLEFLRALDVDHFLALSRLLGEHLDSDLAMPSSIALRGAYHQAIESLMSLLGAMTQAPGCVAAWIGKCPTDKLIYVVDHLKNRQPLLTQVGPATFSFDQLAARTLQYAWTDESGRDTTAARFGRLWSRLAAEFLDESSRAEYNAIKHGLRLSPGGFSMSLGVEEIPGVPAPPAAMTSMGGSQFGSTFFQPEPILKAAWHVRTRRVSINWSAEMMAKRLGLISMSIANVVSALQCESGVDPATLQFVRPTPIGAFDDAWADRIGVAKFAVDTIVSIDSSDELSRPELRRHLERRGDAASETPSS